MTVSKENSPYVCVYGSIQVLPLTWEGRHTTGTPALHIQVVLIQVNYQTVMQVSSGLPAMSALLQSVCRSKSSTGLAKKCGLKGRHKIATHKGGFVPQRTVFILQSHHAPKMSDSKARLASEKNAS